MGADVGFEGSCARSTIYCIFIVRMSPTERRERATREGSGPACLQEDLAQATVGRDPRQAELNGASQLKPDFFQ